MRARQSPYLKSNQQRTLVPDFLVPWKVIRHKYAQTKYSLEQRKCDVKVVKGLSHCIKDLHLHLQVHMFLVTKYELLEIK